ncbi:hypothetical protein FB381_3492 [Nocardioides albertanoniae]|uniref:Nitroimidazol reductase NimA-like FMN-containing flavoprotein (Pyridoxamine 5'-phosphate oxidase superfamily) n=1 Tax=Nocardioides albertanoniae TaxID=1175486 RepID=A0A543AAF5_9ACTN|nr:pyridoxamine 5'-phosphate oxidase family protein [Nocardioides albertanoniae]TQL69582.1 hypothetical protein FB381_3492 [Nocardioides albertanoniae]
MSTTTLSPTPRTRITRGKNRAVTDRERLHAFLGDALVAHLGVSVGSGEEAHPIVLPTAYGFDLDGPDEGGSLYLHGSVAAGWLGRALERDVCVTITELDGLVAARSGFHHSMNYRSALVVGRARAVEDADERERALALVVDQMIPGRWETLRPATRKELAATAVIALPLVEASMKERAEGPIDDPEDVGSGAWAGVIPIHRVAGDPVTAEDSHAEAPEDVVRRAAALAGRSPR